MAFGASDNEIQIVAKLLTDQAEKAAQAFTEGLIDGMKDAVKETKKAEDGIKAVGERAKKAGKEATDSFDRFQAAINDVASGLRSPINSVTELGKKLLESNAAAIKASEGLATVALRLAAVAAGIGVAAFAYNKLVGVAQDGDRFSDIADAFQENADKAGVLADTLLGNLSRAFQDTAKNADLMAQANRAFALGIDPAVFDDLAAAAKRYADATGGDAKQALDELISGVNSGRESLLKKFGTVKDGVLILKEFTDAEYQNGLVGSSVTDVYERYSAQLSNLYDELSQVINNSSALKLIVEGVTSVTLILAATFQKLAIAVTNVADLFADGFNRVLNESIASIITLTSLGVDLASGVWPDWNRAVAEGDKFLAQWNKTADKAGTVAVKLGGATEKAATGLKKVGDTAKEAIDKLSRATTAEIEKAFGFKTQLEAKIEKEVAAAFAAFSTDTPQLVTALDRIKNSILAGITDPEAAKEAAKKLMEEIEKNLKPAETKSANLFGFEIEGLSDQLASALQSAISTALQATQQAIEGGFGREDVAGVAGSIGSAISVALGDPSGQSGQIVGSIIGSIVSQFGKDGAGTRERKKIDAFFADLFDAERISAIINGEIKRIGDLTFEGLTNFGGNVSFGGDGFNNVFNTLTSSAQAGITGLGVAFGQLAGVAEEQSRLIGAALLNNVGTSLENIRALVQATGQSFQSLSEAIAQAFYDGILTIQELYEGLVELQEVFSVGFPDAIGDVTRALENFQAALADGRGSRQLINSLRDAAAEAEEIGLTFPSLVNRIGETLGLTAQQTTLLLEFLKQEGIDTVEELKDASLAQLAAFLESARRIRDQGATELGQLAPTPQDPTATNPQPGLFPRPSPISSAPRSSSRNNTVDKALQDAKRQRDEIYKLLTASEQYASILKALNNETITQAQASRQIGELYSQIEKATKALANAEKDYRNALDKRGKKQAEIAKLAQRVQEAQKKLDDLTNKAGKTGETPKFDVSGALKLVQSVNELAIVARAAGVDVAALTSTLTEGFLRGRLSITEYRNELKKLEETFSDGIPGAIGDVQGALKNLFEGGKNGGLFSVDAFKDVFAEFEKLFGIGSSERRRSQFQQLTNEFNEARDALQAAISGGAAPADIDALRKQFEGASKALDDFKNSSDKADFADLRSELEKNLSPEQVQAFFGALEKEGIKSFDEIRKAGPDAITRILGSLDELGFGFGDTSERVKGILDELDKANIKQTQGKDILGQALDIIKGFNADTLTNSFGVLGDKISETLDKLSQLGGNTFDNDVVLNVRVAGENGALSLVDALFGDGGGTSGGTAGPGPGLSPDEQREFSRLAKLRQKGKLSSSDRKRYEFLRKKSKG